MGRKDRSKVPPLRKYQVVYVTGRSESSLQTSTMDIDAHFAFDNTNEGKGLVFRRYNSDDDVDAKTYVVAEFKEYIMYKETK